MNAIIPSVEPTVWERGCKFELSFDAAHGEWEVMTDSCYAQTRRQWCDPLSSMPRSACEPTFSNVKELCKRKLTLPGEGGHFKLFVHSGRWATRDYMRPAHQGNYEY